MRIQRVEINHVRNITSSTLEPCSGLNILYGQNGSGKTSLLEALYLLSCGRSFRTQHLSHVVNKDAPYLRVVARLVHNDGHEIPLGIEYKQGRIRMRAAGSKIKKTSELANYCPCVVIHQESHQMITQGPRYRRRFLDWGVFHVEPSFILAWTRYQRALKQRNLSLQGRSRGVSAQVWDDELAQAALHIHSLREQYLEHFFGVFKLYCKKVLSLEEEIAIEYKAGWPTDQDYADVLKKSYEQDCVVRYTRKGPHRADLNIRINGIALHEYASRGQQKLVVIALYLAQVAAYQERTGKQCLLLLDDLAAELDEHHLSRVLDTLQALKLQVFMTGTSVPDNKTLETITIKKMFHVKHGNVREVL